MQGAKATAEAEIRKLDVPKGAGAKAALEALQVLLHTALLTSNYIDLLSVSGFPCLLPSAV